jgi:very-short-patch-repair endonuclease
LLDDLGMSKLFLATEALAADQVTRRELAHRYTKVHRNVYTPRGLELTAADRAVAAWMWSGRTATVAGLSAAALLGSKWVPADVPAELVCGQHRATAGIVVHKDSIADDEVRVVGGVSCTTAARTAFDIGRRLPFEPGLIRVDALLNATRVPMPELREVAARYPGARNVCRLRQILDLADAGAESPQETRVRLVLIRGNLPRPDTQIPIRNASGRVVRRIDMGWSEWKVGVEYDGEQHWTDPDAHARDIDRLDFLAGLGWQIVRVSAVHLRYDQTGIVRRAACALRAAGWPGGPGGPGGPGDAG